MMKANYEQFDSAVSEVDSLDTALRTERDRFQQPDVALMWDWLSDEKRMQDMLQRSEKDILVHNRSREYIYNVQIMTVLLGNGLAFDVIPEIAPNEQHRAVGRWDGRCTNNTNYVYFFGPTEEEATRKGMYLKKPHNRGLSDAWFRIPMTVIYWCHNIKWQTDFEFTYDVGDESYFTKLSGKRN